MKLISVIAVFVLLGCVSENKSSLPCPEKITDTIITMDTIGNEVYEVGFIYYRGKIGYDSVSYYKQKIK